MVNMVSDPSRSPEYWRTWMAAQKKKRPGAEGGLVVVPKDSHSTASPNAFVKGRGIERVAAKWIELWRETCPQEVFVWTKWQRDLKSLLEAEYGSLANSGKARSIALATNFPVFVLRGIGRDPPQGIGDPNWAWNDPEAYDRVCRMIPECLFVKGTAYVRK
jgi:hypothetical protein